MFTNKSNDILDRYVVDYQFNGIEINVNIDLQKSKNGASVFVLYATIPGSADHADDDFLNGFEFSVDNTYGIQDAEAAYKTVGEIRDLVGVCKKFAEKYHHQKEISRPVYC